jgi:hypothetical protein
MTGGPSGNGKVQHLGSEYKGGQYAHQGHLPLPKDLPTFPQSDSDDDDGEKPAGQGNP